MKRLLALVAVMAVGLTVLAADKKDPTPREALQNLNDFIGSWTGNGGPDKANPASKDLWKESVAWTWKLKGDDAWLVLTIKDGKYFKGGEVRWLADKKLYQMKLTDKNDKEQIFEGQLQGDPAIFVLERTDPDTKESQQIKMNTTNEGIRLNLFFAKKAKDRTLFTKDFLVAYNKDGESIGGAKDRSKECVVTGGLGTSQVSFGGKSYWVCCSGCRDAFMENPEKFIKEFEARKKMK